MATWTCPDCGRTFGQVGRSHMCNPGLTAEEDPETAHPVAAPIHDRALARVSSLEGEVIVDPVQSATRCATGRPRRSSDRTTSISARSTEASRWIAGIAAHLAA